MSAKEIEKYGMTVADLERLIREGDRLELELQFATAALAEPDVPKMCQLLECARFISDYGKQPVH